MSGNRVTGRNQIAEVRISGVWYPMFCCKTVDYQEMQELIEVTSVNSAVAREYEPGMSTATLAVSGVTVIDNTGGQISFAYFLADAVRRVAQPLRIRMIADNGTTIQISFSALITTLGLSRQFGQYSQSSVSFTMTGAPTIGPVDPPVPSDRDQFSDYWVPGAGHNYVDGASSGTSPSAVANGGPFTLGATDTLLEVDVEGTEYDVIVSGTPGNRECKFNTSTFVLTFQTGMIFDGTQRVFIEFKRSL